VASENSPDAEEQSSRQAVFFNRLPEIFRAARIKPAIPAQARRNEILIENNDFRNCLFHVSFDFLKSLIIVPLISEKSFVPNPGKPSRTTSALFFIFVISSLNAALILLFILLRPVAFFEIFLEIMIPKRDFPSFLKTNFKIKKPSLKLFPFLKTKSKSFFLVRRFAFGIIMMKELDRQFLSVLPSSPGQNLPAGMAFLPSQKSVAALSLFFLGLVSKRHSR
jgi:hypothetical protein